MQIADANAEFPIIFGQIFSHPLGQRGNQHTLALLGPHPDFAQQIIHLPSGRPDLNPRIEQPRRSYDLFDHPPGGSLQLIGTRRR